MTDFTYITSGDEFAEFLERVDWLHDGIIREAGFVSRGYVDEDRGMWGDTENADVVIIIQMQSASTPGVELLLSDVTACRLRTGATPLEVIS